MKLKDLIGINLFIDGLGVENIMLTVEPFCGDFQMFHLVDIPEKYLDFEVIDLDFGANEESITVGIRASD